MRPSIFFAFISLVFAVSSASAQNVNKRKETSRARSVVRSLARLVANHGGGLLRSDFDSQTVSPPVKQWLEVNKDAIYGAGPSPFEEQQPWGVTTTQGNRLFLHVMKWPKDRKIQIPRLHNSLVGSQLIGSNEKIKLTPQVTEWDIALPDRPKWKQNLLPVLVLEFDAPVTVAGSKPPIVKPTADGTIALHSRYSIVHGEMLRFEPQSHKNTVGYWVKEKDWVEWAFRPEKGGRYQVQLKYGCGNGQGGSEIEIVAGDQKLPFVVEATGGFQAWREVEVGEIEVEADQITALMVKPKSKAKNAVMDIQEIKLIPR